MLKSLSGKDGEPYLDGLRGLAALMVLAHHAIGYIDKPFAMEQIRTSLDFGFHGVSLFFVGSAFTLTRSWMNRNESEKYPIGSFYLRRCFRILPFWWLNVAFIQWVAPRPPLPFVANVFMFFSFVPFDLNYLMVPYGWSIGVEETFYVLFPLWMFACRSFFGLLACLFLFTAASYFWLNNVFLFFPNAANPELSFTFPIAHYFCFFIGILVYRISTHSSYFVFVNKINRYFFWLMELLVLGFMFQLQEFNNIQASFLMGSLLLVSTNPRGFLHRLLPLKVFSQIGICCYSFYLLHFYTLDSLRYVKPALHRALPSLNGEMEFLVLFIYVTLLTYIVSAISFLLIERTSVNLGKRFRDWIYHRHTALRLGDRPL
jgi:peptidoglycan/LPS O-acetylase OafA/YrhL